MRIIFGALIATILMGIYIYLIYFGYLVLDCITTTDCTTYKRSDFNPQMGSTLALIGGLVSALVVAELTITKPGEAPAARLLAPAMWTGPKRLLQIVTLIYLLVWLLAGLVAFVVGYLMNDPATLPPLSDVGQAWLGIAVGSAYAYLGIEIPKQ